MSNYWRVNVSLYALIGAVRILAGDVPYVPEPLEGFLMFMSFALGIWSIRELWRKESA